MCRPLVGISCFSPVSNCIDSFRKQVYSIVKIEIKIPVPTSFCMNLVYFDSVLNVASMKCMCEYLLQYMT